MNTIPEEERLARSIAQCVREAGGRAFFVGGCVRDRLLGLERKDIDLEVYGIPPQALFELLRTLGEPYEKGASFGVLGLRHSDLDIAMPRRESRMGQKHTDFAISVDPFLSTREACLRRDFTFNAMLEDPLTGEITDHYGGEKDLKDRVLRHVADDTFPEDALRVFRGAQFAARLKTLVAPETMHLMRGMDVSGLSRERVFEELSKALLRAEKPSVFFRVLRECGHLGEYLPAIRDLIGVRQNPVFHPEGDVFEHTMLVLDCAAEMRDRAREPLNFMLAALMHDLGKTDASFVQGGRIRSPMHPVTGVPIAERQLGLLTENRRTIAYVKDMVLQHMRPNMMAAAGSHKSKSRRMFDESICPEDLILLSQADAMGSTGTPYEPRKAEWLWERLGDYRECLERPMLQGRDLIEAGWTPGPGMGKALARARQLHFSGMEKDRVLKELMRNRG